MSFKSFDRSLQRIARTIPEETLPESLHPRVMALAPTATKKFQRRQFLTRLAIAGLATATVATGMVIAPRYFVSRSYAAEIRQAIANTKTWHFSGWRRVDGKQVPWEVWGRRSPYLYRESIGKETLFDDGVRRVHVIPPDLDSGRSQGIYLVSPSEQLKRVRINRKDEHESAGYLAGIGAENMEFGTFQPAPGNSTILSGEAIVDSFDPGHMLRERTRMDVNASTKLPAHYEVVRESYVSVPGREINARSAPESRVTVAETTPQYDVPLSQALAAVPAPPPGYAIADALSVTGSAHSRSDTSIRKGMTLQATVVGQDASGNIRLRFSGRLGSQPIRYKNQGLMLENLLNNLKAVDDQGNHYLYIDPPAGMEMNSDAPEVWLTPTEPIRLGAATPTHLDLGIMFQLARFERSGNSGRSISVLEDHFNFLVPLPEKKGPLGYEEAPVSDGVEYVGVRPTILMETAEKRGLYYMTTESSQGTFIHMADGQSIETGESKDHNRQALVRAKYWYQIVAKEAQRTRNQMKKQLAQSNLAAIQDRLTPSVAP